MLKLTKNEDQQKRVFWIDEAMSEMFARWKNGFSQPSVERGGGSVLVWGCSSPSAAGDLVQTDYITTTLFFIFMQGNEEKNS